MSRTSSIRIAAAVLAAGGAAASALLATGGGGGGRQGVVGPGPLHHPLVYQSASGNDSTCRRNLRGRPCLTVTKACSLARPNYVIYKIGASPARVSYRTACGTLTASIYVAQSSAGSGSGSSCANAKAATFFNTAGNWGAGNPIAPGAVVGLCGTVTTALTFQGSGTAGNPVTLLFQAGAKVSLPTCGCVDASASRSYITIDGGTNGIIEATDDGVGLGHQTANRAIDMQTCSHCTVQNLTIRNIFVMPPGGTGSDPIDHTLSRAVSVDGTDFTFKNNVVHDVGWAIYDNAPTNVRIEGNDFYNFDHGVVTSGGGTGPVLVDHNHFHDMGNWDCGGGCHHDGIHCFTVNGGTPNDYSGGIYIYDNRFDGTLGTSTTAEIFGEGNTGPSATPCSAATDDVWIFNDVLSFSDHQPTNPLMEFTTGKDHVYNNTFKGLNTGGDGNNSGFNCCAGNTGTSQFENNALTTFNRYASIDPAVFTTIDYNLYANAVSWGCGGGQTTFAAWKTCVGGDSHGSNPSDLLLNGDATPQGGSPVLGAGTNLTSLCTGLAAPLCADFNGNARPAVGAWDAGAFN